MIEALSCSSSSCSGDGSTTAAITSCCDAANSSSEAVPQSTPTSQRHVTFADESSNRYYKRKGSWLNKAELYYSKVALREIRAEATALAKVMEQTLESSQQHLRGYEGLAPQSLQLKSTRRKRARDVVFAGGQDLADRYAEVVEEAVQAAIKVAEGDAKEVVMRIQEEEAFLPKTSRCLSPTSVTKLNASLIQTLTTATTAQQPKQSQLQAQNSSFHTDKTISVASSVCSYDDLDTQKTTGPANHTKRNSFKTVVKFGKRLLRSKSLSSSSASWKQ